MRFNLWQPYLCSSEDAHIRFFVGEDFANDDSVNFSHRGITITLILNFARSDFFAESDS